MAKTNEKEETGKVKVDHKPELEMSRGQKSGNRAPMYGGPKMTPGNKKVGVKRRY